MTKIFESEPRFNEDSFTVLTYSDGSVEFKIDAPWHGSSETGFGESLDFSLQLDEAVRLRDALSQWIARTEQRTASAVGG